MNIYAKELLDHYKNPRNFGELENADFITQEYNPSCGDRVQIFGKIRDGRVIDISFVGHGCVISLATASMLTESVRNKFIDDILKLDSNDILNLINIKLGPTRLKCALLSLYAIQSGVKNLKD
jgi:nitrogen fixation protein NifU and related proteins